MKCEYCEMKLGNETVCQYCGAPAPISAKREKPMIEADSQLETAQDFFSEHFPKDFQSNFLGSTNNQNFKISKTVNGKPVKLSKKEQKRQMKKTSEMFDILTDIFEETFEDAFDNM